MSWTRRFPAVPAALLAALTALLAFLSLLVAAPPASAHEERPVALPDGSGSVPRHRDAEPDLVVCKTDRPAFERRVAGFPEELKQRNLALFERCEKNGYRHLQEAVDAVDRPGMNIAILPGLYEEEPSLPKPTGECAVLKAPNSALGYQILSYEQQLACRHNQNLVAILGKTDLQIEGTGASRLDVVIDAKYQKLNAIRADKSNGIYFRNFTAQRTTFNSLYVLAGDGFVIDDVLTRWNDEYGFLTFASDHGLYKNCESYGNGDSGIYPGSASNINDGRGYEVPRYSIEITGCRSHHNMVGYSGTAGDSVWAHDNEFDQNMGGASMDSAFPGHPGLPQNHAKFERNLIHDNNQDYYPFVADGTCAKPPVERGYEQGVVCPQISMPPGTGIITAGGNWNLYENNWVYGHRRAGFFLSAVPAFIRGEEDWGKQTDTSHHNRYAGNVLGKDKSGASRPNGMDVWWDGQGRANCWQDGPDGSTPGTVPQCGDRRGAVSGASARLVGEPVKLAQLLVCADYNVQARKLPAGCDWYGARGAARVETQLAAAVAAVLLLVGGVLWWRRLRGSRLGTAASLLGLAGLVLDVAGSTMPLTATPVPALALLLTGLWWTGVGLALRPDRPWFARLTLLLGGLTLLDAFDKAVLMIPWIPVGPAWIRGLVAVLWVLWAVIASARPGTPARPGGRGGDPGGDPRTPGHRGRPPMTHDPAQALPHDPANPAAPIDSAGGRTWCDACGTPPRAAHGPRRALRTAALVAVLLLLAGGAATGCGGRATTHHKPGTSHEEASGSVGTLLATDDGAGHRLREVPAEDAPEVRVSARPDTEDGWNLQLTVRNFRFTPDSTGGAALPGAGHAHLELDGRKLARLYGPWFHLPAAQVPEGAHTLTVRLYADDHTAWAVAGKPVEAAVPLTGGPPGQGAGAHTHAPAPAASSPPAASPPGGAPPAESPQADRTVTIAIRGGKVTPAPGRTELRRGERVALRVTSERADTLHVHGYDKELALPAGQEATLTLTADRTGLFEVETHESGLVLTQLLVR